VAAALAAAMYKDVKPTSASYKKAIPAAVVKELA